MSRGRERIALLTYGGNPQLSRGELLLPPAFAAGGIEAEAVPWDEPTNWRRYNSIILRSCWNYHHNRESFLTWMDERAAEGIAVYNPPEIVRWNTDKRYLFDLAAKGATIIPTVLFQRGSQSDLQIILASNKWNEAVIKPTVGASAYGVARFSVDTADETMGHVERFGPEKAWIIQEFRPEINTQGEYSLVFFDRVYSHAVRKIPALGDYRVQSAYGGTQAVVDKRKMPEIIPQAEQALDAVDGSLLYARVDGIVIGGVFHLMELELAEPYLFFERNEQVSPQRFVDAYKKLSR